MQSLLPLSDEALDNLQIGGLRLVHSSLMMPWMISAVYTHAYLCCFLIQSSVQSCYLSFSMFYSQTMFLCYSMRYNWFNFLQILSSFLLAFVLSHNFQRCCNKGKKFQEKSGFFGGSWKKTYVGQFWRSCQYTISRPKMAQVSLPRTHVRPRPQWNPRSCPN